MNDIQLAILGSKKAAKRLTDAEIMIPCPFCGKIINSQVEEQSTALSEIKSGGWGYTHFCVEGDKKIGNITFFGDSKAEVIRRWNTRPPILSEETLAELEERNAHD